MHIPRCTRRLSVLIAAVVLTALPAMAQSSNQNRTQMRRSSGLARDTWQPTRPSRSVRQVDHEEAAKVLPKPVADATSDTVLDGQIIYETGPDTSNYHSSSGGLVACDAMPMGSCGCGSIGCGGCDAIGGCDSLGSCGVSCGGGCTSNSCCGELCSPSAWRPCVTLCMPQDGWISFEYLSWWQDGMYLPPLVTGNNNAAVARAQAGVLGQQGTDIRFGGGDVLTDHFDGGRLRFGVWLDKCHQLGVGAEFFRIGSETESYSATSTGSPVLARPFFNVLTGQQDSELIAYNGVLTGTINAAARSELTGGGFNFRRLFRTDEGCANWTVCGGPNHYCSRNEMLLGYRHLDLDEGVTINENLVSTDAGAPGSFNITDTFDTRNQFNGVDIGWMYKRTRGYWTFETLLRLGLGNTKQTVTINGSTTITDPLNLPAVTRQGGLLAQRTNIGTHERDEFSVIPEIEAKLGYQLTDHLRATFGYNFIYWSNVVRPGEHISLDVNPNLLPPEVSPFTGPARPEFRWDSTDYWVQGISVGAEYRW